MTQGRAKITIEKWGGIDTHKSLLLHLHATRESISIVDWRHRGANPAGFVILSWHLKFFPSIC
jgi:hypothetical protein